MTYFLLFLRTEMAQLSQNYSAKPFFGEAVWYEIQIYIPSNHDDVIKMEIFSALLAICAGNSPVSSEFPPHRPVTHSFDVFFDLHQNKWLSKQSWGWWFEMLSHPLCRHRNAIQMVKGQAKYCFMKVFPFQTLQCCYISMMTSEIIIKWSVC